MLLFYLLAFKIDAEGLTVTSDDVCCYTPISFPKSLFPLTSGSRGTKTLGTRLATHIIMRSLSTMFISAVCVKRVIYTEVYFCSFVAEISSKLVLSFLIPKMINVPLLPQFKLAIFTSSAKPMGWPQ